MTEQSENTKISGKVAFGVDYLFLMREVECREFEETGYDAVTDAVARLFLLQWGFTVDEIDQANSVYMDLMNRKKLPEDIRPVFQRVAEIVKKDPGGVEKFVTELAAVGFMSGNVTDNERGFVNIFETWLDLRPSEFNELLNRGYNWSIALNFLGKRYMEKAGVKV